MRALLPHVALVLVLVIAALLARDLVWRPMIEMHRVGIAGLYAEQGRRCDLEPYVEWHACSARRPWTPSVDEQESVLMARGTRQITQVMHWWNTRDSATWSHLRDSISTALDGWGGHRTPCHPYDTSRTVGWRFADQDVRLSMVRLPGPKGKPPNWWLLVQGNPVGEGCVANPDQARRWRPVGDMAEHLWQRISASSN